MGQNIQISEIIIRFELLRPKPNDLVRISDVFNSNLGQLGLKSPNRTVQTDFFEIQTCQNPNVQKSEHAKVSISAFPDFGCSDFGIPL